MMFVSEYPLAGYPEAAATGYALYLLSATDRVRLTVSTVRAWLQVPIRLDQCVFIFDKNGLVVGYSTWAFVSPKTIEGLQSSGRRLLMPEEWNDGDIPLIVDIVAPFGHLLPLIAAVMDVGLKHYYSFSYFSRKNNVLITKRVPQLKVG